MVDRGVEYLRPTDRWLHVYTDDSLTNGAVFDFLADADIQYEAAESGIHATLHHTDEEEGVIRVSSVTFVPEEDRITVWTPADSDFPPPRESLEAFAPELVDVENLAGTLAYTYEKIHPAVTLEFVADVVDDAKYVESDTEEPPKLVYENDVADFEIYDDVVYETLCESDDPEDFREIHDRLNSDIATALPSEPDHFEVEELPNGWLSPLLNDAAATDRTDLIDPRSTDPFERLFENPKETENEESVFAITVLASLMYALDQLDDSERRAYHESYSTTDTMFGEILMKRGGEVASIVEIVEHEFWDAEAEKHFYTDVERQHHLKAVAEGYREDHSQGDVREMKVGPDEAVVTVELTDKRVLEQCQFPHLPVWVGTVKQADGDSAFDVGEEIVVDERELIDESESTAD